MTTNIIYPVWGNRYGIAQELVAGTPVITGYGLPLTEKESYSNPGLEENNTRKATGVPYQDTQSGYDFLKTNKKPGITLPFHMSSANMALILASFFQNVTHSGSGPYVYQYDPYTDTADPVINKGKSAVFYAFTLYKEGETGQSKSDVLAGCIAKTITISSAAGGPVEVSAEIIAMVHNSEQDTSAATFTSFNAATILHSDFGANVELAGTALDLASWSITLENNAVQRNFTTQSPAKIMLGDLDITTEIVIPWGLVDYKAAALSNTDYLFEIWKGSKTGASAGDFYVKNNFNLNTNPQVGDNEGMKAWTLTGTGAYDGTNPAIQMILATTSEVVDYITA